MTKEEVGRDVRRKRIGENERVVREEVTKEVMYVLKMMKGGKAAGMNNIMVERLKNGVVCIIEWLMKIFNKCMEISILMRKELMRYNVETLDVG